MAAYPENYIYLGSLTFLYVVNSDVLISFIVSQKLTNRLNVGVILLTRRWRDATGLVLKLAFSFELRFDSGKRVLLRRHHVLNTVF